MGQWSHDITGVIGNWGVTRNVKAEVRFWGGVMVVRDTPSRDRRKGDRKEKRSEEKKVGDTDREKDEEVERKNKETAIKERKQDGD